MTSRVTSSKEMIAESLEDSQFWNVHDEYKGKTLEELQELQMEATLPFSVCILNLTGDLNIGMVTRTACVFGAQEVVIFGRRKYDKRSTVGAQNYMPVDRVTGFDSWDSNLSFSKFKNMLEEKNYFPIFLEQGGEDLHLFSWHTWYDMLYSDHGLAHLQIPCIVLGNENEGIPEEFFDLGTVISVTQRGVLRSLNVSSAASIAIHHLSNAIATCERVSKSMEEGG